jgi:hypothetical protein
MPVEGETRIKDDVEEIYFAGEWVKINGKRENQDDKGPKYDCVIKIGDKLVLEASARPKTFPKSGRKGYRIDLKPNQILWGSGNFMMKSKK